MLLETTFQNTTKLTSIVVITSPKRNYELGAMEPLFVTERSILLIYFAQTIFLYLFWQSHFLTLFHQRVSIPFFCVLTKINEITIPSSCSISHSAQAVSLLVFPKDST